MQKISVVIPIFNVEKYLDRCVKSICNQTYKNVEIILVDDGSTDSSAEMCDKYAKEDKRIKVIHKENGGLSDARNVGLEHATGEYVYFCDSDDYVEKDLISDCMGFISADNLDILIFAFYRLQDGIVTVCREKLPEDIVSLKNTPELLLTSPSACNKVFSTNFLKKSKVLFPKGKLYEDLGTIPKLYLLAEKIRYIDKPYYYYEIRGGSIMTAAKLDRAFNNRIEIIDHILDYYREANVYSNYEEELEFWTFYNGMFLPIRESALRDCNKKICNQYKNAVLERFPDCLKNSFINNMSKKEKLFVQIIKWEQYWIFPILSNLKKLFYRR
ncbi:MAG: glycosyltransferase family 2 protein [Tyzzerella sp.]|nr:glycosyltransferase family 2 protein [Tyzzerella sp.]